eukprot:UN25537
MYHLKQILNWFVPHVQQEFILDNDLFKYGLVYGTPEICEFFYKDLKCAVPIPDISLLEFATGDNLGFLWDYSVKVTNALAGEFQQTLNELLEDYGGTYPQLQVPTTDIMEFLHGEEIAQHLDSEGSEDHYSDVLLPTNLDMDELLGDMDDPGVLSPKATEPVLEFQPDADLDQEYLEMQEELLKQMGFDPEMIKKQLDSSAPLPSLSRQQSPSPSPSPVKEQFPGLELGPPMTTFSPAPYEAPDIPQSRPVEKLSAVPDEFIPVLEPEPLPSKPPLTPNMPNKPDAPSPGLNAPEQTEPSLALGGPSPRAPPISPPDRLPPSTSLGEPRAPGGPQQPPPQTFDAAPHVNLSIPHPHGFDDTPHPPPQTFEPAPQISFVPTIGDAPLPGDQPLPRRSPPRRAIP